ncbi:hypothetical protein ACFL5Q_05010 [Planctomycetota bacterium]
MSEIWQNVAVLAFVVGAIVYVTRRVLRRGRSKEASGCPACSECLQWWKQAPFVSDDPPEVFKQ